MVTASVHHPKAMSSSTTTVPGDALAEEGPSDEQKRTLWVGGIPDQVTEEILYELFLNAGPLESVRIPVDRDTKRQKPFAFIVFNHEESVPYAVDLFQDVRLFGRNLRLQNKSTGAGMTTPQPSRQQSYTERTFVHQRSMSAPFDLMQQQHFAAAMGQPIMQQAPMFMNGMVHFASQPFGLEQQQQQSHQHHYHQQQDRRDGEHRYEDRHHHGRHHRSEDRRDRPYDRRRDDDRRSSYGDRDGRRDSYGSGSGRSRR